MIGSIIDGISVKLNATFGNGYEIYTELKHQDLKEPCFSIMCVNPSSNQVLGNRYFRSNLFCIQYFPSSNEPKAECNQVLETLYTALEYISAGGDLLRGDKMHSEYDDGVLIFFVNFDLFVRKSAGGGDSMDEINASNINVKG